MHSIRVRPTIDDALNGKPESPDSGAPEEMRSRAAGTSHYPAYVKPIPEDE
jgi:hypothetical protein